MRMGAAPPQASNPTPSVAAATDPPHPENKQQDLLASVEDFLERTRSYANLESAPSSAPAGKTGSTTATPPQTQRPAPVVAPDQTFANTQVSLADDALDRPKLAIPALQAVNVRWNEPPKGKDAVPARSSATNSPLDLTAVNRQAPGEQLLVALQREAAASKELDAHWRFHMARLALEPDSEGEPISKEVPEPTRNLLSSLIETGGAIRRSLRDPTLASDQVLLRAGKLKDLVAEASDPVISSVALCKKVLTFGSFEEIGKDDLVSGRTLQTIVYCEIANLRSEQLADASHQSRLAAKLEVLTADGRSVWQRDEPEILDTCRRKRTDFFVAQRITLPPTLPAGDYVLKVFVEDKLASRASEAATSFTIVPPISVARRQP